MSLYDINGNVVSSGENSTLKGEKLIDVTKKVNTGYSGTQQEQYGSNINLYGDLVNVSEKKTLYYKTPVNNKVDGHPLLFGCYDENENFLYLDTASESVNNVLFTSNYNIDGIGYLDNGTTKLYSVGLYKVTFPSEVKYIQVALSGIYNFMSESLFAIGHDMFADLMQTWDDYLINTSERSAKTVDVIGDSLTNWGGGNDLSDGFLKVVHDKTGVITKNEGYAGAWWQTGEGQTYCAVNRVNTLISEGRKYDVYCFIMGTNAGSDTDTGETSADTTTMSGAIRYCMETLKAYHPTAKIIVCLPPQRAEGNANQENVNEVIKKIAESYSVKTLDLYHHSGAVPNTVVADSNYLSDGLHLAENGYIVIGDLLASEVKYQLCL